MALTLLLGGCASAPAHYTQSPRVQTFIQHMVKAYGFHRGRLENLMRNAKHEQKIIDAMNHPAEALPWYKYRPIFLGKKRISQGVKFMRANQQYLDKAQARYGVPPAIITAIIGVETRYGRNTGSLRVLDALYTLSFDYPPRHKFFMRELAQFLLLTRKQGIDPESVKGSYAGAMGLPQFIASTYRHYAVDFNGDGKIDLWHQKADAIGSVANYLHKRGWQPNAPIAVRANVAAGVTDKTLKALHPNRLKANLGLPTLAAQGIRPQHGLPMGMPVGLLKLKGAAVPQVWLGAPNFYVITTYNHSPLYAMAVYQLARAIDRAAAQAPAEDPQPAHASPSAG